MGYTGIEYGTRAWNPFSGCLHTLKECPTTSHCYARLSVPRYPALFGGDFRPRFHSGRLEEPLHWRKPQRVLVGFHGDMFGNWETAEDAWDKTVVNYMLDIQLDILSIVRQCPQHTFLFLTKAPHNLARFNPWPPNAWVGASVCNQEMMAPARRALARVQAKVRWLSVEPLLGPVDLVSGADWLTVGAQTGPGAMRPQPEWVRAIRDWATVTGVPLFEKSNLRLVMGPDYGLRQELPEAK